MALNAVMSCQRRHRYKNLKIPLEDARYTQPRTAVQTELNNIAQMGSLKLLSTFLRYVDQTRASSLAKDQVRRDAVC